MFVTSNLITHLKKSYIMKKLKSFLIIIIYLLAAFLSVKAIYSETAISFFLLVAGALILPVVAQVLKNKL